MQKISINGLALFFGAEEQNAAELIRQACERSVRLIQEHWGLDTPKDCRIYVMTSWLGFVFRSAPWPWKILLAVTMPLWAFRAQQTWSLAGGWEQRYGQRRTVGVKPPRLLQLADRGTGDRIFVKEENIGEKVQSITCHELTHAFTSHLRLPTWLKEGLAMVMVDRFFEKPTVQHETLAVLEHSSNKHSPGGYQKLQIGDEVSLVYLYVRGYWLTRYIEETRPGLLKDLLSRPCQQDELESRIATAYEKRLDEFWNEIDGVLASHFVLSRAGLDGGERPE
jgi:hypothetical protein